MPSVDTERFFADTRPTGLRSMVPGEDCVPREWVLSTHGRCQPRRLARRHTLCQRPVRVLSGKKIRALRRGPCRLAHRSPRWQTRPSDEMMDSRRPGCSTFRAITCVNRISQRSMNSQRLTDSCYLGRQAVPQTHESSPELPDWAKPARQHGVSSAGLRGAASGKAILLLIYMPKCWLGGLQNNTTPRPSVVGIPSQERKPHRGLEIVH